LRRKAIEKDSRGAGYSSESTSVSVSASRSVRANLSVCARDRFRASAHINVNASVSVSGCGKRRRAVTEPWEVSRQNYGASQGGKDPRRESLHHLLLARLFSRRDTVYLRWVRVRGSANINTSVGTSVIVSVRVNTSGGNYKDAGVSITVSIVNPRMKCHRRESLLCRWSTRPVSRQRFKADNAIQVNEEKWTTKPDAAGRVTFTIKLQQASRVVALSLHQGGHEKIFTTVRVQARQGGKGHDLVTIPTEDNGDGVHYLWLRHPIQGQTFDLVFDADSVSGTSGSAGLKYVALADYVSESAGW